MNQQTGSHSTFKFSQLTFVLSFIFTAILISQNDCLAQGKLRRVSNAVRKHQSAPKSQPIRKEKPPRKEKPRHEEKPRHDKDSNAPDNRDRITRGGRNNNRNNIRKKNRKNLRNNQRHNHGSVIFVSPPTVYSQPIVEAIVEPVFVPVHQTSIVEAPVPVIGRDSVILPPAVEHEIIVDEPIIESSPIVVDDSIGRDWFYDTPSRFWATIGSDFDGITTGGIGINFQSPGSIGLDGSIMRLRESTENYRDHLWIGDVNLLYEVLATDHVRGRIGVGINWLNDAWGSESGFNLAAGLDVRLTNRLLLQTEGDVGSLGDADYFHGRVNLATRLDSCELLLGVDHFNIGGTELNIVFTGIQFRF